MLDMSQRARSLAVLFFLLVSVPPARAQKHIDDRPFPDHFEIGRLTFFDFGPPSEFYEILTVRPDDGGSLATRIMLTPPGVACVAPANVESSSVHLNESVSALLGKTNPCMIPGKDLRRELKRCKHCMVFSGVDVTMHVPCGASARLIRSDILDRDMFDPSANTPEHTSWTMQLLGKLDQALGPGVLDKPMFPVTVEAPNAELDSKIQQELESGVFDELFPKADQKPSALYRATQARIPPPSIYLVSSVPFEPLEFAAPGYPPLSRLTHTQGSVSFVLVLDSDGNPTEPVFTLGHPLLRPAVRNSVLTWKFPKEAGNSSIWATIQFDLKCAKP
jgi:hypothetical protein